MAARTAESFPSGSSVRYSPLHETLLHFSAWHCGNGPAVSGLEGSSRVSTEGTLQRFLLPVQGRFALRAEESSFANPKLRQALLVTDLVLLTICYDLGNFFLCHLVYFLLMQR